MCGNEKFEKARARAEIQNDTHHNIAGYLSIESLVRDELGQNKSRRRVDKASASSPGSSCARSSASSSGQVRNCAVPCKQPRRRLTLSTRLGRRHPPMAHQDAPAQLHTNRKSTSRSRQASTHSSLPISLFFKFKFLFSCPLVTFSERIGRVHRRALRSPMKRGPSSLVATRTE